MKIKHRMILPGIEIGELIPVIVHGEFTKGSEPVTTGLIEDAEPGEADQFEIDAVFCGESEITDDLTEASINEIEANVLESLC